MAAFIPLLAKYALGQGLEKVGLPAGLANPKGYALGQLKSGVDSALGVMPGTTNFVTDPKGAIGGMAKDAAKDALKDIFTEKPSKTSPEVSVKEPEDDYDFDDSGMDGGFGGMPEMPDSEYQAYKRGGKVKAKSSKMSKPAPKMSTASRRGDGIAQRGKTRGRMV